MSDANAGRTDPDEWSIPVVFVDTTEFRKAPLLDKAGWPELLAWSRAGIVDLVVSDVVLLEAQRQYMEQRRSDLQALHNAVSRFDGLDAASLDLDVIDKATTADASGHRLRLRKQIDADGGTVLPLPTVSHSRILDRDLAARKPFSRSGTGYRDALIWESLLEHLRTLEPHHDIVIVTGNANDFAGETASGLDRSLESEISSYGGKVKLFPSLRAAISAIAPWAEREMKLMFEVGRVDEEGFHHCVAEAVSAAAERDVVGKTVGAEEGNLAFGDVDVPSEIEGPTVELIDVNESTVVIDVYDRYEGDTLAMQASVEARIGIEGFAYKSDIGLLDEEVDILDFDWNDHMMLVGLERDVELRYYVTTINGQIEDLTFDSVASV